jgi:RNA polymerase sigma-70 factor (ECF subfamily)
MDANPDTFESYRPLLFSIAYQILGSAMEAEDIVQEAYLRFQNAHDVRSVKAYLTTIVTHLCLDQLKSARVQREDYIGTWFPEPVFTGDSPGAVLDRRESVSMAFLVLLENLAPVERAIFLLRDVFEYPYAEIAPMVGKTEANCRRYYRRAKHYLMERRPRFEPSSAEQVRLLESFLQAATTGDVAQLTSLLAEDATLEGDGGGKAPAVRQPVSGRDAIIRFLSVGIYRLLPPGTQTEIVEINGAPSVLFMGQDGTLYFVMNVAIVDGQIHSIRNILNPDKLGFIRQHSASYKKDVKE